MPDYVVTVEGSAPIPVRASNQAQARNYAVRHRVKVEALSIDAAMQFGRDGVDIHDATAESEPEPSASEEE